MPVPKQNNRKEENEAIKNREMPEGWKGKPHKLAQKDRDARWTKKNSKSHYGYKNHINTDVEYGFIRRYEVTDATVHDSKRLTHLLDGENEGDGLWADSAYRGEKTEKMLELVGFESQINERAYRNRPLSESQTEANREKPKTRAKVEHVFGGMVQSMGGKLERVIGQARIETQIGLKNLVYNLKRYVFWKGKTV
ncbi:MAG: IS5 family transposase [Cyanobacteria bacterium P01_G01_bin.54]